MAILKYLTKDKINIYVKQRKNQYINLFYIINIRNTVIMI